MMMLYNGDTDFFDIVAGVLQRYVLVLFIVWQDYALWTSADLFNENSFTFKKISIRYLAEKMTDADYENNFTLLANTPARAESLHSLKEVLAFTGTQIKPGFFKQGVISILSGKPLKLVNQFTYLDCNISSNENDVIVGLAKA